MNIEQLREDKQEIADVINELKSWQCGGIEEKERITIDHTCQRAMSLIEKYEQAAQLILDAQEELPEEKPTNGLLQEQLPYTYEAHLGYNQCLSEVTTIVARLKGEIEEIKKNALEVEENVKEECRGAINVDAYATIQKLQSENSALKEKVESLKKELNKKHYNPSLDQALNEGNGTYKP